MTNYSPYPLGPYETVWQDDCSECPSHIEFQVPAQCGQKSLVDGRCFRGDWGQENDCFAYHFQFPPEWSSGQVQFTYWFKFWALGSWDAGMFSHESGGAAYCNPSVRFATAPESICPVDFEEDRVSNHECGLPWAEWTAQSGTFDPYVLWEASDGEYDDLQTACYLDRSYTHSTEESSITLGFWTWDFAIGVNNWGLTGERYDEAWVVSDFRIEFTPPAFTTLPPDTTATTGIKTTSVVQTTASDSTTTFTTTMMKTSPMTTPQIESTTTSPTATRFGSTSTVAHTTVSGSTQPSAQTTERQTTAELTTTDGAEESNDGGGENWLIWALAGGVSVVGLLLAALWFFGWRKGNDEAESDESEQSQVKITVVTEMQQVLDTRTEAHIEEAVVGVLATPGDCDSEGNELKDALRRVDKAQRDERDSGFGRMLKDMGAGNALLQADVCLEVDGVLPPALCTDKGECESEEWEEFEDDANTQEYITAGNISTSESESC